MSTVSLSYSGPPEQHVKVSGITPMQKMTTVLEAACSKLRPSLEASECQIVIHEGRSKRVQDLLVPFRFANISSSARIEIVKAASGSAPGSQPTAMLHQPSVKPEPPRQSAHQESDADVSPARPEQGLVSIGPLDCDREVVIFSKSVLDDVVSRASAASAESLSTDNLPEEFYDVTPEDIAHARRHVEARKHEEVQLKTRALREAAERSRAEAYGPVPVRLHLPDNVIVQAAFSALEPLSKLQDLVKKLIVPELARPGAFYLYTTPPKQVLQDSDLSFFKAMLVPAAHVYFHVVEGKDFHGPFLKPEAIALSRVSLSLSDTLPGQGPFFTPPGEAGDRPCADAREQGSGNHGASLSEMKGTATAAAASSNYAASGTKVPKWMKIGK